MATVPISGTSIRLMSGIPFNADYKNTRWFDNLSQQTSYFNSRNTVHSMTNASFQRIEGRHFIKVNKSIDDLWGTNYLTFLNRNKRFYAFVTQLEYINDGLTHVHFQIDVLQTWLFEMNFKPSYVVREHRPLWNSDGTPVINTIDEGLNYGTEYDNRLTSRLINQLNGGYRWLVIVMKTPFSSDNEVEGKYIGSPQPLTYYIVPFKENNRGIDITPTVFISNESYPVSPPTRILSELYKEEKAVNNVVSLYITEYTGIRTTYTEGVDGLPDIITFPHIQSGGNSDVEISSIGGDGLTAIKVNMVNRFYTEEIEISSNKYSHFADVNESKLLMSPYTSLVFDDFRGNRTEYKLEHINNRKLIVQVKGSLGLSNNVSYGIKDYNSYDETYANQRSNENALISNTPNDLPVINDMLAAFLQGNRNSIQNQKNSVVWNGVMSAIGSTIGGTSSAMSGNAVGVAQSGANIVKGAGDTVLQLQGIQAKQNDISNIPPQISNMGSNTAYDFGNGYRGIYILRKQIKVEYRRILGEFFKMFGYKTNRVKIPNFHTRKHFNYVQTESCVITGNFNNEDMQELKSIFDNGITLWHTNDIGNYSLSNEVI